MRAFATGVGSKADIGAPPLSQLSFINTQPSTRNHKFETRRWLRQLTLVIQFFPSTVTPEFAQVSTSRSWVRGGRLDLTGQCSSSGRRLPGTAANRAGERWSGPWPARPSPWRGCPGPAPCADRRGCAAARTRTRVSNRRRPSALSTMAAMSRANCCFSKRCQSTRGSIAWRITSALSKARPGRSTPSSRVGVRLAADSISRNGTSPVPGPSVATMRARAPSAMTTQVVFFLPGIAPPLRAAAAADAGRRPGPRRGRPLISVVTRNAGTALTSIKGRAGTPGAAETTAAIRVP